MIVCQRIKWLCLHACLFFMVGILGTLYSQLWLPYPSSVNLPSTLFYTIYQNKCSFIRKHLWLIFATNCGLRILFLQKSLVLLQWQSASMATAGCCHFLEMYPNSGALTIISNSFTLPFYLSFWFPEDLLFEVSSILPLPCSFSLSAAFRFHSLLLSVGYQVTHLCILGNAFSSPLLVIYPLVPPNFLE